MQRLILIFVSLLLTITCAATADSVHTSIIISTRAESGEPQFAVDSLQMEVVSGNTNVAIFVCDDVQWLNLPGEPQIPWRVLTVLLPSDADLSSLSVHISQTEYELIPGTWAVHPTSPVMSLSDGRTVEEWPKDKRIVDRQDADIYECDAFWPQAGVCLLGTGQLHSWRLVELAVPLARYNPVRGDLELLTAAEVKVEFECIDALALQPAHPESFSRRGEARVKQIAINYEQARNWYRTADTGLFNADTDERPPGYVIITTSEIAQSSSKLPVFIAHKRSLGFAVHLITEGPRSFGASVGDQAADNIRAWLQDNHEAYNIEYVLLIGDPIPDRGQVPMKTLYPLGGGSSGGVPSDLYYGDLTGNWDLDGDDYYGEWGHWSADFGAGGVDRYWEVLVGRIPYYGEPGEIDDLDRILDKTIRYEERTGENPAWRKNVLLPMPYEHERGHGCDLGEAIAHQILDPLGWTYHRIYHPQCPQCPQDVETVPCTRDTVTNVWSHGQFGLAVWFGHGTAVIDTDHVQYLNDAYPSFTFQVACSEADVWKRRLNIAWALLKKGGICTIGATSKVVVVLGGPLDCRSDGNGLAYEYTQRIVIGRTAGDALFDVKQSLHPRDGGGGSIL